MKPETDRKKLLEILTGPLTPVEQSRATGLTVGDIHAMRRGLLLVGLVEPRAKRPRTTLPVSVKVTGATRGVIAAVPAAALRRVEVADGDRILFEAGPEPRTVVIRKAPGGGA